MYPSKDPIDQLFFLMASGAFALATVVLYYCFSPVHANRRERPVDANRPVERAQGSAFFAPAGKTNRAKERLEAIDFDLLEVPDHLCCHISLSIMARPVFLRGDNRIYDYDSITEHFRRNGRRSPFTNKMLTIEDSELRPSFDTESQIEAFVTAKEHDARAISAPL